MCHTATYGYGLPVMHVRPSSQQLEEDGSRRPNVLLCAIELTATVLRSLHVSRGVHVSGHAEVSKERFSFEILECYAADMDVTEGQCWVMLGFKLLCMCVEMDYSWCGVVWCGS